MWWLRCRGVNAYLLADDDGLTLVDTGTPFDAIRIEVAIREVGFGLDDVERILVTHYDVDHVGAAAKLSTDAPVYVGRDDAPLVTGKRRPSPTGVKGLTQFVTRPFIRTLATDRVRPVEDGQAIGGFTAHHTPGHTPGHTVFVHEGREAAFLGDTVIEHGGELRHTPWFMCDDVDRTRRSVREFEADAPEFAVAAMGHGTPFLEGGRDRLRDLVASM